jgi:betaine/carnitine transporter, BCCT family
MAEPAIDRTVFGLAVLAILVVCLPIALFPEATGPAIDHIYGWIATNLGIFYQLFAIAATIVLAYLAFGPYGHYRLGADDDRPEFSTISWVGMLFCAGVGAGLLYWAPAEWALYYVAPPYGVAPRSTAAIEWATAYGLFHWGMVPWALYALPTIAIAYPYYVGHASFLRASTACHAVLGARGENSAIGRAIDLIFMIALLGGAGTSLGLATPMIASILAKLFGTESSLALELGVVAVCVALFALSAYLGIEKGIKRLSDINVVLALGFVGFVTLVGPTLFILKMGVDSIGFMLANAVRMITWTDPIEHTGFVENWTVFYWAWWIAYGPFVGLFVTRISRGRTIREVIVNMIVLGSIGGWLFYIAVGHYALHLELAGLLPVTEIMAKEGQARAITEIIAALPLSSLALAAFALVTIIFAATTYDSASYTLAASATSNLAPGDNPSRGHRLFWAAALGALPAVLMLVGGLKVMQSASLVASLPLLLVGVAMIYSLFKSLRASAALTAHPPAHRD